LGAQWEVRFTWDEGKRQTKLAKHGLDFLQTRQLFEGRALIAFPSPCADEARSVSTGVLDGRMVAVVWLERDGGIRVIS